MSRYVDFTTSISKPTFPNTKVSQLVSRPLTLKKYGKIVVLNGSVQLSSGEDLLTDITNAAIVPNGYRPKVYTRSFGVGSGNVPVRVDIGTDGFINLGRANADGTSASKQMIPTPGSAVGINAVWFIS